jgi:agmatine/peptidylarginine deiminase
MSSPAGSDERFSMPKKGCHIGKFVIAVMLLILPHASHAGSEILPAWNDSEGHLHSGALVKTNLDPPPPGTIVSYPEWHPADGVIISWKWFDSYFTDLTAGLIQSGKCWIVVENASQQSSVTAMLIQSGISLDNVYFLQFDLDTIWIIDYGPFFISVGDHREIVDHRYFRPLDDVFPQLLGNDWEIPVYSSPLWIEGGNFIADGMGTCFITSMVFEENVGYLTPEEIRGILRDYCGCSTLYVTDYLQDYTGHIDMFAKLLDIDTMLIGQYQPGDQEYELLENIANLVSTLPSSTGEPYDVIRIPMPGNPADYWTYTNSLIVNDHVFVPVYDSPEDANALEKYETAMPGYTVIGINSLDPINWGGAIHCTTKVVPHDGFPEPTSTPEPTHSPIPASPTPESTAASPTSMPTMPVTPTQSCTASAVPTNPPSTTQTPSTTRSPAPSPSFTWTPTCTETPVPSSPTAIQPSPTAIQPTHTPVCSSPGVILWMPAHEFQSGDSCRCSVLLCNPGIDTLAGIPLFVILEVAGDYFYAPSFANQDHYMVDLNPGVTMIEIIQAFTWPDNIDFPGTAVFYAAMTDAQITTVIGNWDLWELQWR